jgi:hypothetical protein
MGWMGRWAIDAWLGYIDGYIGNGWIPGGFGFLCKQERIGTYIHTQQELGLMRNIHRQGGLLSFDQHNTEAHSKQTTVKPYS